MNKRNFLILIISLALISLLVAGATSFNQEKPQPAQFSVSMTENENIEIQVVNKGSLDENIVIAETKTVIKNKNENIKTINNYSKETLTLLGSIDYNSKKVNQPSVRIDKVKSEGEINMTITPTPEK